MCVSYHASGVNALLHNMNPSGITLIVDCGRERKKGEREGGREGVREGGREKK